MLATSIVSFAFFGNLFYLVLYLEAVGGFSPLEAGAILLPGSMIGIAASPFVGRVVDRWHPRWLLPVGLALVAAALFLLSALDSESSIFLHVLPGLILNGFGYSMVSIPAKVAAVNAVSQDRVGRVASLVSVSGKLSAGLGVAASSAIFHGFSAGNVQQSLEQRATTVGNAFFDRLVDSCLGLVNLRPHLEHLIGAVGGPGSPPVPLLEQVLDEAFFMTLGNTYTVGAAVTLAVTAVVFWRLRPAP